MGKSLISQYLRNTSQKLVIEVEDAENPDFLMAERNHLDTDHCQVGGVMAFKWRFPTPLRESIQFHHRPFEAPEKKRPMVYAIHVADRLAMLAGEGTGGDTMQYPLDSP